MDIKNIKSEFPIFKQKINGKPLVYLDSANSSQKPKSVISRISNFYETEYSNVGRSVHSLAVKATNRFEETRDKVQKYINAKFREEIISLLNAADIVLRGMVYDWSAFQAPRWWMFEGYTLRDIRRQKE